MPEPDALPDPPLELEELLDELEAPLLDDELDEPLPELPAPPLELELDELPLDSEIPTNGRIPPNATTHSQKIIAFYLP